ncbi:MAG: DUF2206 domain-containing protein [Nitrososphaerota archaeon]|nr:DUF2206 domain-containing protein [Nitrososphaerota archaeon]
MAAGAVFGIGLVATSVAGISLMNAYSENWLEIIFLLSVLALPMMMVFRPPDARVYPMALWTAAVALVWHTSLFSNGLVGFDIQGEYYVANLVLSHSSWHAATALIDNGALSVVLLAPAYSLVSHVPLIWTFKLTYPFLFSLVPLVLYRVFRSQTSEPVAFLGSYYIVVTYVFYTEILAVASQEIAELLLVMLVLFIVEKRLGRAPLVVSLLTIGVVISDYSIAYLTLLLTIIAWVVLLIARSRLPSMIVRRPNQDRASTPNSSGETWKNGQTVRARLANWRFLLLLTLLVLSWNIAVAASISFSDFVGLIRHAEQAFVNSFLNPLTVQGVGVISSPSFPLQTVSRYLTGSAVVFAVIGLVWVARSHRTAGFQAEYTALSVSALILFGLTFIVPDFGAALNIERIYHVSQLLYAPLTIVGLITIARVCVAKFTKFSLSHTAALKIVAVFLSVFFLFNSGVAYLASGQLTSGGTAISLTSNVDYAAFNLLEVSGATWMVGHTPNGGHMFADVYRRLLLADYEGNSSLQIPINFLDIPVGSEILLGSFNIQSGSVLVTKSYQNYMVIYSYERISDHLANSSLVYDNSGTKIFLWSS